MLTTYRHPNTPRPGFEPDQCPIAKGWIGKRVVSRLDGGWGDKPLTGICVRANERNGPNEFGWFNFLPDEPSEVLPYGDGTSLAHVSEFELS